nr:MAG: hypothetical protein [Microvirus sp.]
MSRGSKRDSERRDASPVSSLIVRPVSPSVATRETVSVARAPDPVRVVSAPRADTSRGNANYNDAKFSNLRTPTAIGGYSDSPHRAVADRSPAEPGRPDITPAEPDPVRAARRGSSLKIEVPKLNGPSKAKQVKQVQNRTNSSPEKVRDNTCKARPENNRPKGGGGGSMRKFIPWCT